jgi:hypothetical protein
MPNSGVPGALNKGKFCAGHSFLVISYSKLALSHAQKMIHSGGLSSTAFTMVARKSGRVSARWMSVFGKVDFKHIGTMLGFER